MQIDESSPVFRRPIIPWYDSEAICLLAIIFLYGVVWFGTFGVIAAMTHQSYISHIWLPVLLIVMSGGVILSIAIRLVRRFAGRFARDPD